MAAIPPTAARSHEVGSGVFQAVTSMSYVYEFASKPKSFGTRKPICSRATSLIVAPNKAGEPSGKNKGLLGLISNVSLVQFGPAATGVGATKATPGPGPDNAKRGKIHEGTRGVVPHVGRERIQSA